MSRLEVRTRFGLLVAVVGGRAAARRSLSAQAVTGTISGTVADPQGQVIPGATVTVINEATNDARVAVSDARGRFPGHQPAAGPIHGPDRAPEFPHARAQEHRPQRRRAAGGRRTWRSKSAASARPSPSRPAARTSTPPRRSTAVSSPPRRSSRSRCSAATSRRSCGCCRASATRTPSTRWA